MRCTNCMALLRATAAVFLMAVSAVLMAQEHRTIKAGGVVVSVAYSADGKTLAAGLYFHHRPLRWWRVSDLQLLASVRAHVIEVPGFPGESPESVRAVVFSSDGKTMFTSGDDDRIRKWDVQGKREVAIVGRHKGARVLGSQILCLEISPDGKRLVSAGDGGMVVLWDISQGKKLKTLKSDNVGSAHSLSFSPDGKRILVTGNKEDTIELWDVDLTNRLHVFPDASRYAVFAPNEPLIGSIGESSIAGPLRIQALTTVTLWNTKTLKQVRQIRIDERGDMLAFAPRGHFVAIAMGDGPVALHDTRSGRQLAVLRVHVRSVNDIAFSPDGRQMATGSSDGTIRIWDVSRWTK